MIELNDLYDYGLKIYQNKDFFKFSLDSILLGEFVKVKDNDFVLDICTGNAPIPLILSTKYPNVHIDAIELQEDIYDLAVKSVNYNDLQKNINIIKGDIKNIYLSKKYDCITCNPPYFRITDRTYKNLNKVKQIQRHEICLTLEDVITFSKNNLNEKGTFYMVHRVDRFLETIELLKKANFGIRKIVFIYTKKEKNAEIFLIEASKYKKDDIKVKSLSIENLITYKNIFEE